MSSGHEEKRGSGAKYKAAIHNILRFEAVDSHSLIFGWGEVDEGKSK